MQPKAHVVVVGAGNAAFSAAQAAREHVDRVYLLEKAPREWLGGNSYFTAGAFRTTHNGLGDLRPLLSDVDDEVAARIELPPYSAADFAEDLQRLNDGRSEPRLTRILVDNAGKVMQWLHRKGLRFRLMYERQAYQVDGKYRFWGGLAVGTVGGGIGLVQQHLDAAEHAGIHVLTDSPVTQLMSDDGRVTGVIHRTQDGREVELAADAVVLASGGFQASEEMRTRYLGARWRKVKLRGTPYNSGETLRMAIELGAQQFGDYSGGHAIAWDVGAPPHGDRGLTNRFSRQSYPIGIVVNRDGVRFLDEGADFRNYTYASYGAAILDQPGGIAFQLFDAKTAPLLSRIDYSHDGASRLEAGSVSELAAKLGIEPAALTATITSFNRAVQPGVFNPAVKDGKRTRGITPPKSNWAQALDSPPFAAYPVTCGLTFTYGGLRIDDDAAVLRSDDTRIEGLFAAGEIVGGLFHRNYPGGSGLMAGSVFGYRAGKAAAAHAHLLGQGQR